MGWAWVQQPISIGLIQSRTVKGRKVMTTPFHRVSIDIEPYAQADRVELA